MSITERIRLQGSSGVIFQRCVVGSNTQVTLLCPLFTWTKAYYFEGITNLFEFNIQTKVFIFLSRIVISYTGQENFILMANLNFAEVN